MQKSDKKFFFLYQTLQIFILKNLTGAVQFNRWKTELFGNVSVLYHQGFIDLNREPRSVINPTTILRNRNKQGIETIQWAFNGKGI